MKFNPFKILAVAASIAVSAGMLSAATISADSGWVEGTATSSSSTTITYSFTLTSDAWLSLTDIEGAKNVLTVYEGSTLILTTNFDGNDEGFDDGNSKADAAWEATSKSSGSVLLSAGTYTITILTSCTAKKSCSDDFYIRLDSVASAATTSAASTVPVPGALPALGGGLALLALLRRRRG